MRPGADMVDIASPGWHLTARVRAGGIAGAHRISQGRGRPVTPTPDIENGSTDRVRDKTPPG
ncbi:hypothetical protein Q604_UNBC01335G0001, partial [human gut metagenome]